VYVKTTLLVASRMLAACNSGSEPTRTPTDPSPPTAAPPATPRVESVAKDILDGGFHPVNTFHPHRQSQVGAATIGYVRDLWRSTIGAFGVGADVTGYRVPANLQVAYGRPWSWHVFVRYRGSVGTAAAQHVH
jgi:hypothetical protein